MILNNVIILATLIVSTYTDLRWREVPDWVSYSTIAAGLGIALIVSINSTSLTLLQSITAGLIGLGLGALLYYLGQWGGGDAKLLAGIGTLLGISWSPNNTFINFLIMMILVGAVYGILWAIIIALKNHKKWKEHVKKGYIIALIILLLVIVGLATLINTSTLTLDLKVIGTTLLVILPILILLLVFIKTIEKHLLVKEIPLSKISEGEWVAQAVKKNKNTLYTPQKTGITKEDITRLKKEGVKTVFVKIGMPFVPAMLIAYVLTVLIGSPLLFLF